VIIITLHLHCTSYESVSSNNYILLLNTILWSFKKWYFLFVCTHFYAINRACVVSIELWGESRVFRDREQRGWRPVSIAASVMIKSWADRVRGSKYTLHACPIWHSSLICNLNHTHVLKHQLQLNMLVLEVKCLTYYTCIDVSYDIQPACPGWP